MLSHKDLNDFEINDDFKNKKKDYVGMNNAFDYISQYSKIWERQRNRRYEGDLNNYFTFVRKDHVFGD